MLPYSALLVINKDLPTPVYQQIANGIVVLIRNGVIRPGTTLPSSRAMAETLTVHRKTIVAAYEELAAQDWIESSPRRGIIVSGHLPELKPRSFKPGPVISSYTQASPFTYNRLETGIVGVAPTGNYRFVMNDGFPDARIAPVDALFRQYRYFLKRPGSDKQIMINDGAGSKNLRTALASFLAETRAVPIDMTNIITTRGAQMAIFLAARLLLRPGSRVVVAEPNYRFANIIFEEQGAKLVKVGIDEEGIDVDAIEKICKKNKPDLLYIIPHHHHPTTVTLSARRRMKLLSLIRAYKIPVIEDDYDYDFHYARSPILPLASADHGGYVLYIGSITKSFSSTIRIGYMVASPDLVAQAAELKKLIDIRGDILLEDSLALLFSGGDMQKHLKKSVKLYKQRRDFFCRLLEKELGDVLTFTKPAGGMSVWARFTKKINLAKLSAKAGEQGLYMGNGSFYNSGTVNYNSMRLGFASFNEKELQAIVAILRSAIDQLAKATA